MAALTRPTPREPNPPARFTTLLALVQNVQRETGSEQEVVETVAHLVNDGDVVLTGNFAGQRLELA